METSCTYTVLQIPTHVSNVDTRIQDGTFDSSGAGEERGGKTKDVELSIK